MWPFSHSVDEPVAKNGSDSIARDIIAGETGTRHKRRWTRLLIFYLKALAFLCMVRGLQDWAEILGFVGPEDQFLEMTLLQQATLGLFAVLNCVAAVGLWLTSAWGAVLWLIVTFCEVLLPVATAGSARRIDAVSYILLALALVYVALTWLSARERGVDR